MSTIVHIAAARESRDANVERAWQKWLDLNAKAKASTDIKDGIAAGRAYREFMELFARVGK